MSNNRRCNVITMNNITKRYDKQTVLSNVSFNVEKKQIFGLLGPSGAGKTTIINILTNLVSADSGSYEVEVKPHETGVMLEEDGLYPRLNCLDNLNLFTEIYRLPRLKSIQALHKVGLADAAKKAVNDLSKGMKQRLALARAILHEPKVLILDEPTCGLDPGTARGIHRLITDLKDNGSTVLLTTHNMDEAVKLCDHIILLHRGEIVEHGVPLEICEKHNAIKTVPDLETVFIKMTGEELI